VLQCRTVSYMKILVRGFQKCFKPNPFISRGRGDYDRDRDDGTTYDQYDSE
jgi:hypothetical protein